MAPNARHEHQRVYWQAATRQAQQNLEHSNGGDEQRTILMHTLRSWRSLLGCSCCGRCGVAHATHRPHGVDTVEVCSHGIPVDPPLP